MIHLRRGAVAFGLLSLIFACSTDAELHSDETMAKANTRAEVTLADIDAKIVAAERALAEKQALVESAAKDVRYYSCRAAVERVLAVESLDHAQCMRRLAAESECEARESQKKSDSTLLGCIIGIAVAMGSGGAAAPYALTGCAGGRLAAEATAGRCSQSQCIDMLASSQEQRLRAEGWTELPLCGGRLGLEVETPLITGTGVRVADPGMLAAAGVQEGDHLVSLGARLTGDSTRYYQALGQQAGEEVELRFVRQQQMYAGQMTLPEPMYVGARVEDVASVAYHWGVRVIRADSELLASHPDLLGATVSSVDRTPIISRQQLRELLRYRRGGQKLLIEITPAGHSSSRTVEVALRDRDDNLDI